MLMQDDDSGTGATHVESSEEKPRRLGWAFSFFAGAWAFVTLGPLYVIVLPNVTRDPSAVGAIVFLALMAFLAARLSAWVAASLGASDHGWIAGGLTAPLSGLVLVLIVWVTSLPEIPLQREANMAAAFVLASITSTILFLPLCLGGTAAFLGLLRVMRYARLRIAR